jgi:hypothetical protein
MLIFSIVVVVVRGAQKIFFDEKLAKKNSIFIYLRREEGRARRHCNNTHTIQKMRLFYPCGGAGLVGLQKIMGIYSSWDMRSIV